MTASTGPNKIDHLNTEIENCTRVEDWDAQNLNESLLFPTCEIPHLSRGAEARVYTPKPGSTNKGEEFCLSALMSSAALCLQLLDQEETVEFSIIKGIGVSGMQLSKIQFPFLALDGFSSIIRGGTLIVLTTISKNHHGKILGCGLTHSEQIPTVKEALRSFKAGFRVVTQKLGHDMDKIDKSLNRLHFHSDDGPGLKPAVTQYMSENCSQGSESSCSAHIHNDGLPTNKGKLKNELDNYSLVCNHIKTLEKFPRHAYGNIPWRAVKHRWHSMNEVEFSEWFQREHIDKYANFVAGSVALGMPDDNNCLESMNEHKLRKQLTASYRRNNANERLPIALARVLEILRDELIPSWSQDTEQAGWFETEFETTPADRKLAKELMMDPYLLDLGNGLWCARFEGKKIVPLSKETAKKALGLHQEAVEANLNNEGDRIEWNWEEFKLASSVVFISKDCCFPCKVFFRKKMCREVMAIRELLGLGGLSIGVTVEDSDEISRRQRGGNKRQRGQVPYQGIVYDRMELAQQAKKKEAKKAKREITKRRKEQQEELKVNKRPRTEFKCQECGKNIRTLQGLKQHCTIKNHHYVDDEDNGGRTDNKSENNEGESGGDNEGESEGADEEDKLGEREEGGNSDGGDKDDESGSEGSKFCWWSSDVRIFDEIDSDEGRSSQKEDPLSKPKKSFEACTSPGTATKEETGSDKEMQELFSRNNKGSREHSLYKKEYWLSNDDISYIMAAMAGKEEKFSAQTYSDVVKGLKEVTERKDKRTRNQGVGVSDRRFGKWVTHVTNCSAKPGGIHWVLTSVKYSDLPEAIMWDPLKDSKISKPVLLALQEVCGNDNVKKYYTGQQKKSDGWSCGYISVWWKLLMVHHGNNHTDGRPIDAVPEKPPVGWDELVWLMLELRDSTSKNTKASAMNQGLYPFYNAAMNDHTFDFVERTRDYLLQKLKEK